MRHAARKDANHARIVSELRGCGCKVLELYQLGGGVPDTLVCHPAGTKQILVEIKTAHGALTEQESEFFEVWPEDQRMIARSTDDVLARLGMI